MDVKITQGGMSFEWDSEKAAINKKKHALSFDTAYKVFNDINRIEIYDAAHSIDEDRYITIGCINGIDVIIYMVYTERTNTIRIISARKATNYERRMYYDNKKNL